MRILFYAVNGLGLGHVTRLLAIAGEIRRLRPDAEILFLTSSEADSVIYEEGFPAVKVPSKNIARESGLKARIHVRILQETAWSIFSSFNPHVTVVDTFPLGFAYELDPVLKWRTSKFVFIYRQRKEEKTSQKSFQATLSKYDLVIVPHEKQEFGIMLPRGVNAIFAGKIIIRSKKDLLPAQQVKAQHNLPTDKKCALITLGGGGQEGLEGVIDGVLGIFKDYYPEIHPVAAHGRLLRSLNAQNGCTVIKQYFPLCELYNAFDYVIAGCGYNTVNELLYFNKPALFLPFERQVDDQERRAQILHDAGMGLKADPYKITDIKEKFARILNGEEYTRIEKNLKKKRFKNNAGRSARAILKVAGSRRQKD
jgi:predicted glycosyltransferase